MEQQRRSLVRHGLQTWEAVAKLVHRGRPAGSQEESPAWEPALAASSPEAAQHESLLNSSSSSRRYGSGHKATLTERRSFGLVPCLFHVFFFLLSRGLLFLPLDGRLGQAKLLWLRPSWN